MRIWSIHPKYLDSKGLVALWRETLLAKQVLPGNTRYNNHSQLERFKKLKHPLDAMNQYLAEVYNEASKRKFNFDRNKIDWNYNKTLIPVTNGQLKYETHHLLKKLKIRDIHKFNTLVILTKVSSRPIFKVHPGGMQD